MRINVIDYEHNAGSCWEISTDGAHLHPIHLEQPKKPFEMCGAWTPDGKYYFFWSFESLYDFFGEAGYVIPEKVSLLHRPRGGPVKLPGGPVEYGLPQPCPGGKKLFALGKIFRSELMRYDSKSRQFVPYILGISPHQVDASRDGQWVTYITTDKLLWKCKLDGSERRQLTFARIGLWAPRWSPDGTRIAFMGQMPGRP